MHDCVYFMKSSSFDQNYQWRPKVTPKRQGKIV